MASAAGGPSCAEAQAEELLFLQESFGEDCRVLSEDPGHVEVSLAVAADLLPEEGRLRLRAEVPEDGLPGIAGGGHGAPAPGPAAAPAAPPSVAELAEERIRGLAMAPACPRLERSRSGKPVARAEAFVKHLPPITLQVSFPPGYPEEAVADFHLACEWLNSEQLATLCAALDSTADELSGSPIVFAWAMLLRSDTASILGLTDTVTLAVSTEASDVRAVADCVDPMSSLMDLLEFDQQRELSLWRQEMHTCDVCVTEKAGTQFVHLGGCLHTLCSECLEAMASLHVREGTIVELKCPQPDCRAEIAATALQRVLEEEAYDRWLRLKTQQIMTSGMGDVLLCPRCEENGLESPTLAEHPAAEEEAPVATCRHCGYVFCARCLGVAHARLEDCITQEDRAMQMALRKLDGKPASAAERRRQKRAEGPKSLEVAAHGQVPNVDCLGNVAEDFDPLKEGDEVLSVTQGTKDNAGRLLWSRAEHELAALEGALATAPPLVIRFQAGKGLASERLRKKRMWEELMTLRAIKQDSQACPKCRVRISRSQGCNHMRCTHCDTHFCYRCGATMPSSNPYSHFSGSGCPTFDTQEVRRIVAQQNQGPVDNELEELRRQFGRQEDLFAQFQARRDGRGPRRVAGLAARRPGDTMCPTCRQWNSRQGRLNHARCHACRTSYCHHCGRRIEGVVTQHFRGEGACPQHAAD